MSLMLQNPNLLQRLDTPAPVALRGPQRSAPMPRPPVETVLTAGLGSAGEKVLGGLLGIVILVLQFAGYAAVVLVMPLAPFLFVLPLLAVTLALGLLILGVGVVLGALGWL
jgi:hypothetical protein